MKKIVLLVLLLALILPACTREPAPTTGSTAAQMQVSYTIKVVSTDGEPVTGAMVSICQNVDGGVCYMPVKTDAQGVARFDAAQVPRQDNLKVQVLAAEGYALPQENDGYIIIPNGTTEVTLTLEKNN